MENRPNGEIDEKKAKSREIIASINNFRDGSDIARDDTATSRD